jgi:ATP-dependent RNA helicase RhlE
MLMKIKFAEGTFPRGIILVPTRELAVQVTNHLKLFSTYTDLRYLAVYGGVGTKPQVEALEKGIDILIATPGRLLELYFSGHLILKHLKMFVMDEAERLLDMGFKKQINSILDVVPRKRQNILFSATMSDNVKAVAENFLDMPMVVEIAPELKTAKGISQVLYRVPNLKTKINLLDFFLTDEKFNRVIVFCKTKNTATNVFKYLSRKYGEEKVRVIHGNKDQNTRINAFRDFKEGGIRVLITTDVVARGIDITEVSHVINFDVPLVYEDYIHRIGRTGRALRKGDSIIFSGPADDYHIKKIQKLIGQKIAVADLPEEIVIEETPFEENQAVLREIDAQRKKEDPDYQGAFQEKKRKY